MTGALGKFLSKYGDKGMEYGKKGLEKGMEYGKQGLGEALGISKAMPGGAATLGAGGALAGLGSGAMMGDDGELEEDDLKKLLMMLSEGE